jgi:hypothetical protein
MQESNVPMDSGMRAGFLETSVIWSIDVQPRVPLRAQEIGERFQSPLGHESFSDECGLGETSARTCCSCGRYTSLRQSYR